MRVGNYFRENYSVISTFMEFVNTVNIFDQTKFSWHKNWVCQHMLGNTWRNEEHERPEQAFKHLMYFFLETKNLEGYL